MHWCTGVLPRNGVPLWGKASDANNTNSATNEKKMEGGSVPVAGDAAGSASVVWGENENKDERMVDDGWHNVKIQFFPLPASEQILDFCKK